METGEAGRRYGSYEVESFLGKGAIGKVYLARHVRIGRLVALKTVALEDAFDDDTDRNEFYKRLQREAELCGSLLHPNVVTLYEVGYEDDVVSYLATEYVEGESLLARLKRTRPLPLDEAVSIGSDILRGLAYAHEKGIIHRDIKPANILLTKDGRAKITDFGVARPLESSLTGRSSLLGTPNYMSPEQVKSSNVTTRSDLFCAGIVIYEMLTGVKPFAATNLSGILHNVLQHHPPLANTVNPAISESLSLVVAKLIAKNPEHRYATAIKALEELEAAHKPGTAAPQQDLETVATPALDLTNPITTEREPVTAPAQRPRNALPAAVAWSTVLVLLLALMGVVLALRSRVKAETQPTGVITAQQLQRDAAKRRALAEARAFAEAGKYDEAVKRYEAYIAQYPESLAAREEREAAAEALQDTKTSQGQVTVSRSKTKEQDSNAPQQPSRWERFKRWFRGK